MKKVSKEQLTENKLNRLSVLNDTKDFGIAYKACSECGKKISLAESSVTNGLCMKCKQVKVMEKNW